MNEHECYICKKKKETIYYCEECFKLICQNCSITYYEHLRDKNGIVIKANKIICKECKDKEIP